MVNLPDDGLKGLSPVKDYGIAGVMPNSPHQGAGFLAGAAYELAFVEFDDQGRCYDRAQMDGVAERFDAMRAAGKDALVLVFVHGWKHDARTDDANLCAFRQLLAQTVVYEANAAGTDARPVLGIFVGWRGLTAYGPGGIASDATFLGRQEAGHRVSTGSPRELFGRLRHYRNSRLEGGGAPLLVVAGHSFGGMIVFSALAQSLIEAASDPGGLIDTRFADLVLLVNPAIEGARYLPIFDLIQEPAFQAAVTPQLPLFICAQAENDDAVGTFFPIGNARNGVEEASLGALEQRCITHAIGFINEFQTHRMDGAGPDAPASLVALDPDRPDPFWVARADPAVIDGHGGFWQAPFEKFLAGVLFSHIDATRANRKR